MKIINNLHLMFKLYHQLKIIIYHLLNYYLINNKLIKIVY